MDAIFVEKRVVFGVCARLQSFFESLVWDFCGEKFQLFFQLISQARQLTGEKGTFLTRLFQLKKEAKISTKSEQNSSSVFFI